MIDLEKFHAVLSSEGIEFITGVPDTLLNEFCLYVERFWPEEKHVIAANEGNAIGLASGYHLGTGSVPIVYMQNSGLGNTVNPLLSLTNKDVYSIPLVLIIGWRGDPSVNDWAQHKLQGILTPKLLEEMQIPYIILDGDDDKTLVSTKSAIKQAKELKSPVALIAKKGVFEKGEKEDLSKEASALELTREEAIKTILSSLDQESRYVATTGRMTRELHEVRNILGHSHEFDFLNIGAMGHASSIATGLSISTDKKVVCLDGDAGLLMHMGSLPINAATGLKKYMHIVLNNGVHESVGGQKSVGHEINLTEIAKNAGYVTHSSAVTTASELADVLLELGNIEKPVFIDVHIRKGMRSDMPPLRIDPHDKKQQLMDSIKRR